MENSIDIIVDIETLGNEPNSTIIQLAALACNIESGEILDEFNEYIDITKQEVNATGSTLMFWVNQDNFKEMLFKCECSGKSEKSVIQDFVVWISDFEQHYGVVKMWGNGILFDNNILKTHCEKYGYRYPIDYWNDHDIRTLLYLASEKSHIYHRKIVNSCKVEGEVYHDALNDCKLELRYCHKCYDILMNGGEV